MAIIIGLDEAGLGPNLGPLVVCATVWEVPHPVDEFDFWSVLAGAVDRERPRPETHLHIADSKQVHSPARGLAPLELSVLAMLQAVGRNCGGFREALRILTPSLEDGADGVEFDAPWHDGQDLELPIAADGTVVARMAARLRDALQEAGVVCRAIRAAIVFPDRFNDLVDRSGSKGLALSRISLGLVRSVWAPDAIDDTLVIADKHGGRNRYDQLLSEILDGQWILRMVEGADVSRYRVGRTEFRFQVRAESHFPTAAASLVAKYLRELSMELFNRYWQRHVPGLKPTKGYPGDARRFQADIAAAQETLGIPRRILWRER